MCPETSTLPSTADSGLVSRLARFFLNNRFTMDTAEGLSQWIGCTRQEAAAAAETLAAGGLLVKRNGDRMTVYALARTADALAHMAQLADSQ